MTSAIEDPLAWVLLVSAVVAFLVVMRARGTHKELRRKNAALRRDLESARGELGHLRADRGARDVRHAEELAEVRADAEWATKSVLKSAMGTLSSLAEEQQVLLDRLLRKYGDSEVLADLMAVDHTGSQFSRRTKGISVLCGGWLGRREENASVYDLARSAQGRIRDFDRVGIHAQSGVHVVSKAVEPIAVVLAELLDNATKYSAPGTPVEINIQTVPRGVCLIVDDAGVGMSQEVKDRSSALLAGDGPVAITALGDPPRFGFAVCGLLASRYGFSVSADSVSPYGGVRAVVRIPQTLLTADATPPPVAEGGQRGHGAPRRAATPLPGASPVAGTTAGGLPRRRRRETTAAVAMSDAHTPVPAEADRAEPAGAVSASRIGAFARGTRRGRISNNAEGHKEQ
ncbi:ATP-binding protein [Streptomyces bungoensis]|uniref:ATP-binding protein n=1 Tax=Streptomyces bungoensis TaxID=285568 RepID=UPI0033D2D76E